MVLSAITLSKGKRSDVIVIFFLNESKQSKLLLIFNVFFISKYLFMKNKIIITDDLSQNLILI